MEQYWNPMVPELAVSDFSKSFSFYKDIIGFTVRYKRTLPDFAYLELQKVQIMIEQIHDKTWITDSLVNPLGRGVNFQIELDDIEPVLKRLKLNNVKLFQEQKDNYYEAEDIVYCQREFLVQDPDGYLLRFNQYLNEKRK